MYFMASSEALPHNSTELQLKVARESRPVYSNTVSGVIILYPATFAAYGSLVYLGAYFTNFNYGAIFVLIGVGESDIDYIVD